MASKRKHKRKDNVYLPTGRDIQKACEEIRAGLSEKELAKRAGITVQRWMPDVVDMSVISEIMKDYFRNR